LKSILTALVALMVGLGVGYVAGKGCCPFGCKKDTEKAAAVAQAPAAAPAAPVAPAPAAPVVPTPPPKPVAPPAPPVDLGPGIAYKGSPALGDPTQAKAIVYIFSDFQCPVCRRAADEMHPEIPAMLAKGALIVFKHNALEMHKNARPAALAAMAAHVQGKFWVFHDKLFANSSNLSPELFQTAARDLGLDLARFEADLKAPAVAEQVDREGKLARDLDAQGTPSYFVNGKKQVGWGSAFGLKAWVEQEIAAVDKLIAGGMSREAAIQARVKQNVGDKADLYLKAL